MNYQNVYNLIIEKRIKEPASKQGYFETHHIIPRSLGGTDNKDNLVELTAREHFLCHWLLVNIHKDNIGNYKKMIYAFNLMCTSSGNQNRYFSKNYEIARKLYSENHPCKNDDVKKKISDSLKEYNKNNKKPSNLVTRTCECGCGETFEVKPYIKKRFVGRHALRVRDTTKMKETLKATLNNMSDEEKQNRIKNSLMKDIKKRGEQISKGKKGISTKQKYLDEIKYGTMVEEEFNDYIKDRTNVVITRMINRRNNYINNITKNKKYYEEILGE